MRSRRRCTKPSSGHSLLRSKNSTQTVDFKISARGWCYMLEPRGLSKGDFDRAERVITVLRKRGYLSFDFVAEDVTRVAEGVEELDDPDPVEHAENLLLGLNACIAKYRPI